jgi:Methylamine utilisation protein MauE
VKQPSWLCTVPDGNDFVSPFVSTAAAAAIVYVSILGLSLRDHLTGADLKYALAAHGVLSGRVVDLARWFVTVCEGVVVILVLCSSLAGVPTLPTALGAGAAVFAILAAYAAIASTRVTSRDALCGCGVGEHPIGFVTAIRNALLAVFGLLGIVAGRDGPVGLTLATVAVGLSVTSLAVWLPAALARPRGTMGVAQ